MEDGKVKGAEGGAKDGVAGDDAGKQSAADLAKLQEMLTGIKSELDLVKQNNKALLKEKTDAKAATTAALEAAAKKSGDVEALEKSWMEKLTAETGGRDAKLQSYESMFKRLTVGATASRLASELALEGSAGVLEMWIERRLTAEVKDNDPVVRVLGKDFKPSAMTLEDLRKEIEGTPGLAPLLAGSRASGTGGIGKKGQTGPKDLKMEVFNAMLPHEKTAAMKKLKEVGGKLVD